MAGAVCQVAVITVIKSQQDSTKVIAHTQDFMSKVVSRSQKDSAKAIKHAQDLMTKAEAMAVKEVKPVQMMVRQDRPRGELNRRKHMS